MTERSRGGPGWARTRNATAIDRAVDELLGTQLDSGAFASWMTEGHIPRSDENGFITAQAVRVLRRLDESRYRSPIGRAVKFLHSCRCPDQPWAFRFWPEAARPTHLPTYPADADDTAVIAAVLYESGCWSRRELLRTICHALLPHRTPTGQPLPAAWVRPGTFWTWLSNDFGYNVVDCTVNANVAGLMAQVSATHLPGYREACNMIESGVRAAAGDRDLVTLLSPYYRHPRDLLLAVAVAVEAGAEALRPTLTILRRHWGAEAAPSDHDPIFSSAYGRVGWTAPALQRLRAALAAAPPPITSTQRALSTEQARS